MEIIAAQSAELLHPAGAFLTGKTWAIPRDATKPTRKPKQSKVESKQPNSTVAFITKYKLTSLIILII